ncbi:MAG TPA: hypothetical protein VG147_08050 [Solirubrobacteraceae bacterium]|jgi:hypothetical protein|nr:hypothetical protein [Solirubrobacteraceae bacterium]
MLFDLRARGRRKTVQIVYLGLALIFLLGFVGLGVGVGGGGGGILNAFTENSGSNSANFAAKVETAQKHTQQHPADPAAWAALIEAQFHQASEPEYFQTAAAGTAETEKYTAKGKVLLAKIANSWNTYLKLETHHPSSELARKMASAFSEQGLAQPAAEMRALQVAVASGPPSSLLYRTLAESAYKAGNLKVGDAATRKTVSLAPAASRKEVKKYLAEIRKNPLSHTPATISKGPNGELIATQAGKTYTVKSNGKGGYAGAAPKVGATPTPTPTSTAASGAAGKAGATSSTPAAGLTSSTSGHTSSTGKK